MFTKRVIRNSKPKGLYFDRKIRDEAHTPTGSRNLRVCVGVGSKDLVPDARWYLWDVIRAMYDSLLYRNIDTQDLFDGTWLFVERKCLCICITVIHSLAE